MNLYVPNVSGHDPNLTQPPKDVKFNANHCVDCGVFRLSNRSMHDGSWHLKRCQEQKLSLTTLFVPGRQGRMFDFIALQF